MFVLGETLDNLLDLSQYILDRLFSPGLRREKVGLAIRTNTYYTFFLGPAPARTPVFFEPAQKCVGTLDPIMYNAGPAVAAGAALQVTNISKVGEDEQLCVKCFKRWRWFSLPENLSRSLLILRSVI